MESFLAATVCPARGVPRIWGLALAGSIDSQRGRTDIKGDAGADTVLYVANAPVNIDGGDQWTNVVATYVVADEWHWLTLEAMLDQFAAAR